MTNRGNSRINVPRPNTTGRVGIDPVGSPQPGRNAGWDVGCRMSPNPPLTSLCRTTQPVRKDLRAGCRYRTADSTRTSASHSQIPAHGWMYFEGTTVAGGG